MKVYGLTGGIASGKSTVALLFEDFGASVIDADKISRDVVKPGGCGYQKILDAFGKSVTMPDGSLDRRKLRKIIFSNEQKRNILNAIVHPLVMKKATSEIEEAKSLGARIVIYEAALLVETGVYKGFDGLIVVDCALDLQKKRLIKRDNLTASEVDKALAAQTDTESRKSVSDYVITNNGTERELFNQVQDIWHAILES